MIGETYSGPMTYDFSPLSGGGHHDLDDDRIERTFPVAPPKCAGASRRCEDTVRSASVRLAQSLA